MGVFILCIKIVGCKVVAVTLDNVCRPCTLNNVSPAVHAEQRQYGRAP